MAWVQIPSGLIKMREGETALWRVEEQGDQIGRNFAIWAIYYGIGQIFFEKK